MNWIAGLLLMFATAGSGPQQQHPSDTVHRLRIVKVDGDWASSADPGAQPVAAGPLWWWSEGCVAQFVNDGEARYEDCDEGRPIRVSVVDTAGDPVIGARLAFGTKTLLAAVPDRLLPTQASDENGKAQLRVAKGEPAFVRVAGPGFASDWVSISEAADARLIRVVPSRDFSIVLEGQDGSVVHRGHVRLERLGSDPGVVPGFWDAAEHDSDARIPGLPKDAVFLMTAWDEQHAPVVRQVSVAREADTVALPAGGSLAATLLSGDRPVPKGELDAVFLAGDRQMRRTANVDVNGIATVPGLPAGNVEWTARAPGFATIVATREIVPPVESDLGEIQLEPARRLEIHVTDEDGISIEGAEVRLETGSREITPASGSVVFEDAPSRELEVNVDREGYLPDRLPAPSGARKLAVTLSRGAGVVASLVEEATGVAPGGIDVDLTDNGRRSSRHVEIHDRFEMYGLRPGRMSLTLRAPESEAYSTGEIELDPGEVSDLGVVVLKRGFAIRGTVIAEDDSPVARARVRVLDQLREGPMLAFVMKQWREVESDESGEFQINGLTPGGALLMIDAMGFVPEVLPGVQVAAESFGPIDLGSITLFKGRRLVVKCHPEKRCGTEASLMLAGSEFPFAMIDVPMEGGTATFDAAPPGAWPLRLSERQQQVHEEEVTIQPSREVTEVEIDLPSVRVEGNVYQDSQRASGGSLEFTRQVGSSLTPILLETGTPGGSPLRSDWIGNATSARIAGVRGDGTFVLEDVEPGTYNITWRASDGARSRTTATIPEAEVFPLTLTFSGGEIAGIVLDSKGDPTFAGLEAQDFSGRVHRSSTELDGRFRMGGLGAGTVKLIGTSHGDWGTVTVSTGDSQSKRIVLRLDREKDSVDVEVRRSDGQPAAGASVFLIEGPGFTSGQTDARGIASFEVSDPETSRLVAAYLPGQLWTFGSTTDGRSRLELPSRPSALEILGGVVGPAEIYASNGFPIHSVLPSFGIAPVAGPGATLVVGGLPPGGYVVRVSARAYRVSLEAGKTTIISGSP